MAGSDYTQRHASHAGADKSANTVDMTDENIY
jgi:hypothetical protein